MRTTTCLTYIAATPTQVWQALTDPRYTRHYFFGLAVHSDFDEDGPISFRTPGTPGLHGHIVRVEPLRVLMHSLDDTSWITWIIDEIQPGLCRVTLLHDDLEPGGLDDAEIWHRVTGALKTVLETGHALIR
jgi:uncharacterized protein YndB with AHSA1/START domain